MKMRRSLSVLLLTCTLSIAATARIAPEVKPISQKEWDKLCVDFGTADTTRIPLEAVNRALTSLDPRSKIDAAGYLAIKGDSTSIPFLIDALSDDAQTQKGGFQAIPTFRLLEPYEGSVRYWANESLKKLTRQDFAFTWDAPKDKREKAIKDWLQWYKKQKDTQPGASSNGHG